MATSEEERSQLPVEYMQHVGQALPDITVEFLSAQTTQSSEIHLKEKIFLSKQAELRKLQDRFAYIDKSVCTSMRTICLKEDLLSDLEQECAGLEKDVSFLVQEKLRLKYNIQKINHEEEMSENMRIRYQKKIESYQFKMEEMEKKSATQLKLQQLREKIVFLKSKRENYFKGSGLEQVLSGEKQTFLQDKVSAINTSRTMLRDDNSSLEEKINADSVSLKKDRETERKRRAAQVRRLQRLVSDAQARRRQWLQEGESLRNRIMQVKPD